MRLCRFHSALSNDAFVGLHSDETPLPWRRIVRANIRVQGSFGYADSDFRQALDWLSEGKAAIPLTEMLAGGPVDEIKVFLA